MVEYFTDISKMRKDRDDLEIKIDKALEFIGTDTFRNLSSDEKSMIHSQIHAMQIYYEILNMRIRIL